MSPSMMKIALPVLAAIGSVYADSCSSSDPLKIQNSGDAPTSCETYTGSIAVETGAAGPISLDGIKKIDGDLTVLGNSNLQSIGGKDLEEVTGKFDFNDVSKLNTLNFPKLTAVKEMTLIGLPVLQQLGTNITKASSIDVENTQLQNLVGVDLMDADTVIISNNFYISSIQMQLSNVSKALTISNNNPEVNVTLLNLESAANLTFINCSSVAVPSLNTTSGSLGFYGNVFDSFSAGNLTKVGGALAVVSNTELTNISFPQLTSVSADLQVSNNTKLAALNQTFPKLETIGGALQFNGNFSSVALPALNEVRGTFTIKSTGDIQSTCDNDFKPLKDKGKIRAGYLCKGKEADPNDPKSTPTGSDGAKKTGAAVANNVGSGALMAGLAAAFFL